MGVDGYFRSLTRGAPAMGLARAAARRASRVVQRAWSREEAPPADSALLTAFGIDHPSALPGRIFYARPNVVAERASVTRALEALPAVRDRALARARDAADRRFRLFGHDVWFAPTEPIDWSLDPISGHSYPSSPSDRLTLLRAGIDPKFPWALGRLDQAIALGQGYWAATDGAEARRFADAFRAQVLDFLQANPRGIGVHWTCPMEVALRGANLAIGLLMFEGADPVRTPSFLLRVMRALWEHARHVESHLENEGAVPNNHLVSNFAGLMVIAALFPELPGASRWAALATRGLRDEMRSQVHEDGVSFEGSTGYHRLSVELFTLGFLAARAHGFELGSAYAERLRKMYRVVAAYCSERGLAPQLGDNDSGRALPFRERESLDHGYLSSLGAALFDEPRCKLPGAEFADEAVWTLGEAGRWRFDNLAACDLTPGFTSRAGGLHVLRGAGATLTVSVGAKGQRGVGGHSHHDQLGFELHLEGTPVIVDPGCGQYTRDPAQRNFFRSTAAHNVVQIDGRELGPLDPARLFALPDPGAGELLVFQPGALARLEARHGGLASQQVRRTFLLDSSVGALNVIDEVSGDGQHRLTSRLHLPDTHARVRALREDERARALAVPQAPVAFADQVVELGPAEAPHAVVLVEAGIEPRLVTTSYSRGYAEVAPALEIVCELERGLPARAGWLVLFGQGLAAQR
jgi:hypothetical protein